MPAKPILSDDPADLDDLAASVANINAEDGDCPDCDNPFDDDPPQRCRFCGRINDPVRWKVADFDRIFCDGCGTRDFGLAIELTFAAKPRLTLSLCEKCADVVEQSAYIAVRQVRDASDHIDGWKA